MNFNFIIKMILIKLRKGRDIIQIKYMYTEPTVNIIVDTKPLKLPFLRLKTNQEYLTSPIQFNIVLEIPVIQEEIKRHRN